MFLFNPGKGEVLTRSLWSQTHLPLRRDIKNGRDSWKGGWLWLGVCVAPSPEKWYKKEGGPWKKISLFWGECRQTHSSPERIYKNRETSGKRGDSAWEYVLPNSLSLSSCNVKQKKPLKSSEVLTGGGYRKVHSPFEKGYNNEEDSWKGRWLWKRICFAKLLTLPLRSDIKNEEGP